MPSISQQPTWCFDQQITLIQTNEKEDIRICDVVKLDKAVLCAMNMEDATQYIVEIDSTNSRVFLIMLN